MRMEIGLKQSTHRRQILDRAGARVVQEHVQSLDPQLPKEDGVLRADAHT